MIVVSFLSHLQIFLRRCVFLKEHNFLLDAHRKMKLKLQINFNKKYSIIDTT